MLSNMVCEFIRTKFETIVVYQFMGTTRMNDEQMDDQNIWIYITMNINDKQWTIITYVFYEDYKTEREPRWTIMVYRIMRTTRRNEDQHEQIWYIEL